MTKLYAAILAVLACNCLSARDSAIFIDTKIDGQLNPIDYKVVENAPMSKLSVETETDLSVLKSDYVHFAMLLINGKSDKNATCASSLTVWFDGQLESACTTPPIEKESKIVVTNAVNKALRRGDKSIKFRITQEGLSGAQSRFLAKNATLMVAEKSGYDTSDYLNPMWRKGKMTDESVFFIDNEDGTRPSANLAFAPTKILKACMAGDGKTFEEGKDFIVKGKTITLTKDSSIYARPISQIYPSSKEDAKKYDCRFRFEPVNKYALFNEGDWFQRRQIFFTYLHEGNGWTAEKFGSKFDSKKLPRTIRMLKNKTPLKIVLFGDSISEGANASGLNKCPPYMPSWGDLVADALRKHYNAPITYLNRALGGTTSHWGLQNIDSLVAEDKPDFVIIAFGMNDAGLKSGLSAENRRQILNKMMNIIRAKNPHAEFLIVTGMQPNAMWRPLELQNDYPKVDKTLETSGVAVVDIWDAHKEILKNKKFIDITGNNVNHPNDWLIRLYAQMILAELMPL